MAVVLHLYVQKEKMADCRRYRMFFALLRTQAGNFGIHFRNLIWCLRIERGETTGRKHFHALIAGLPPHSAHTKMCFAFKNLWEKLGGGMARVSVYSRSLAGADYILKGLEAVQSRVAGDFYELTKFGGSCDVTLSESILRVIEGRRVIGQRRQQALRKAE